MYKLIEWIRVLTQTPNENCLNNCEMTSVYSESSMNLIVNRKRHTKYFQRCLDVLPPRLASHDSTRFVLNASLT